MTTNLPYPYNTGLRKKKELRSTKRWKNLEKILVRVCKSSSFSLAGYCLYTLVNSAGYAADLPGDPTPIFVIDLKVKMPKFDEFSVRPLSGGAKSVYADVITDSPLTR